MSGEEESKKMEKVEFDMPSISIRAMRHETMRRRFRAGVHVYMCGCELVVLCNNSRFV